MKEKIYRKLLEIADADIASGRKLLIMPTMGFSGFLLGFSGCSLLVDNDEKTVTACLVTFVVLTSFWLLLTLSFTLKVNSFFCTVRYDLPNGKEGKIHLRGLLVKKSRKSIIEATEEIQKKIEAVLPKIIESKINENSDAEDLLAHHFFLENEASLTNVSKLTISGSEAATIKMVLLINSILKEVEKEIPNVKFYEIFNWG